MTARVVVEGETLKGVTHLPRQVLFEKEGKPVVYVREGTQFKPVHVKVARVTENRVVLQDFDPDVDVALVNPETGATGQEGRDGCPVPCREAADEAVWPRSSTTRRGCRSSSTASAASRRCSSNKVRSFLTMLGMIFGVAAVVSMMSIGAGAQQQVLAFIEQLGVRNLIVEAKEANDFMAFQKARKASPGLTERDLRVIRANVPGITASSARKRYSAAEARAEAAARGAAGVRHRAELPGHRRIVGRLRALLHAGGGRRRRCPSRSSAKARARTCSAPRIRLAST